MVNKIIIFISIVALIALAFLLNSTGFVSLVTVKDKIPKVTDIVDFTHNSEVYVGDTAKFYMTIANNRVVIPQVTLYDSSWQDSTTIKGYEIQPGISEVLLQWKADKPGTYYAVANILDQSGNKLATKMSYVYVITR